MNALPGFLVAYWVGIVTAWCIRAHVGNLLPFRPPLAAAYALAGCAILTGVYACGLAIVGVL